MHATLPARLQENFTFGILLKFCTTWYYDHYLLTLVHAQQASGEGRLVIGKTASSFRMAMLDQNELLISINPGRLIDNPETNRNRRMLIALL